MTTPATTDEAARVQIAFDAFKELVKLSLLALVEEAELSEANCNNLLEKMGLL